jgi:hypothetical protein
MIAWRLTEIDDLSWRLGAWIFTVLIPKYSGLLSGITWGQVLISRSSVNILSISCDVVPSNVCVYIGFARDQITVFHSDTCEH